MSEATKPAVHGRPCWVELYTRQPEVAAQFYRELFGWTITTGEEGGPMARPVSVGEHLIASIEDLADGVLESDGWLVTLQGFEMDRLAARVEAAGGQVVVGPIEVDEVMSYAVVRDRDGLFVGVLDDPSFAPVPPAEGAPVWYDVLTRDLEAGAAFYREAMGWSLRREAADGQEVPYYSNWQGDESVCGIGELASLGGPDASPAWQVYFYVGDVDAACRRVVELGGNIISQAADTPWGRMAEVADPLGARFVLFNPQR